MSAFEKIIGYKDIKAELIRFADVLKNTEKYSELGVTLPSGLLLYGDPGLGKTLMAKCFIEESGRDVFILRKEKSNGEFVNEIKKTYDEAKKSTPSIVFLDDMDKFANEDEDHPDAEEYVTIQSCIDECKEAGVFTIATVNRKSSLPDSLLRPGRFDEIIDVYQPEGNDAYELIKHFLSTKKVMKTVDVDDLSMVLSGSSCAELETIINNAGIYAAYDGRKQINHDDIIRAYLRNEFMAPECIDPIETKDDQVIALHEAGHAVVAELLEPESVTLVSVSKHIGNTGGITHCHEPEEKMSSEKRHNVRIMVSLAGKAAVETILGQVDMGCHDDMRRAFRMVRESVDQLCSAGFDAYTHFESSDHSKENQDRLVASEMERYYGMVKKMLIDNKAFLVAVSEALKDHKTITYREMQTIRKEHVQE